jgi:HMGL-like
MMRFFLKLSESATHFKSWRPQRHWFSTETLWKRPSEISIVEVGPRDGLQNERQIVSADDKIELIKLLIMAGCRRIEVGAMVHPKLVPNMANSLAVMQNLFHLKKDDVHFSCLIPKLKYLEAIVDTPVDEIAIFASATETFSQKVSVFLFLVLFEAWFKILPLHTTEFELFHRGIYVAISRHSLHRSNEQAT